MHKFVATVSIAVAAMVAPVMITPVKADTLRLYAAGSLKAALGEVARDFEKKTGGKHQVETEFGASGLLRERIEKGEPAHVFASADMKHPQTLAEAGRAAGKVRMFARNELCAIAQPEVDVTSATLLDRMLSPDVRVGTSTPKADPSGDYAFALFGRADALKAGAKAALEAKALRLTGGPDTQKAPDGRNQYGWVMSEKKADIFLTYCTNAVLAKKDMPSLKIVEIPAALAVGANYGMIVLKDASAEAEELANFILAPSAQKILRDYGFGAGDDIRK
jgi:molybdate transport system substrate-binding protein